MDYRDALKRYFDTFEKEEKEPDEEDYDVEEFVPESEQDVTKMLNEARRLGIVT